MYLSLKEALKNGEKGRIFWASAVTTILHINKRLKKISVEGYSRRRILPMWQWTLEAA